MTYADMAIARRVVSWRMADRDAVHAKLRRAACKRMRSYLWVPGDTPAFTPALSPRIYGDGRALFNIATINQRPRFHILRVDSLLGSGLDMPGPSRTFDFAEMVDTFYGHLEEDFGRVHCDCGECPKAAPWPAFDDEGGCSWSRAKWPEPFNTVPHPFSRQYDLLGVNE